MRLSISTNWNADRHEDGVSMIREIQELGFDRVELGYALTFRQADDIRALVAKESLPVTSVHAFCPNPLPDSGCGPEPYRLCDERDWKGPRRGIKNLLDTLRFASEVGAKRVVLHAGRTEDAGLFGLGGGGPREARKLNRMVKDGLRNSEEYEKELMRYIARREKAAVKPLEILRAELDEVLPECEKLGVVLCLENLPTADGLPNEPEMSTLLREYEGEPLAYWHDIGHAQIRHELGLMHHPSFVKRIAPHIGGFHIHDVFDGLEDHGMPPGGHVDFSVFKPFVATDVPLVLEPHRDTPAEEIARALAFLNRIWETSP